VDVRALAQRQCRPQSALDLHHPFEGKTGRQAALRARDHALAYFRLLGQAALSLAHAEPGMAERSAELLDARRDLWRSRHQVRHVAMVTWCPSLEHVGHSPDAYPHA
jgi:hypothetical protein